MKKRPFVILGAISTTTLWFAPRIAQAACLSGPAVTVNRGHGASIVFDEPVYSAQIFDPSRLIMQPIPEQGTTTLLLSQVEAQSFPGMPQTPSTTLLAQTAERCFSFEISYGDLGHHVSVDATSNARTPSASLPHDSGANTAALNLENLRAGYELAILTHGEGNIFLRRVEQFLTLTEQGANQQSAALASEVQWSHLQALERQGNRDRLENGPQTIGI